MLGNQNGKPKGKVLCWDGAYREPEDAFLMSIDDETCECWLWMGPFWHVGYGHLTGKPWGGYAHRYAVYRSQGFLTPNHECHHVCGEKRCVRVDHIVERPRTWHRSFHSDAMVEAQRGRPRPRETRDKISEGMKRMWADRRH